MNILNIYKYMFFLLFFSVFITIPIYAKSIEYTIKKDFKTKLKVSEKNDNNDIIGGYAKYKITLYIDSQKNIDFLIKKQDEISKIIEKSVGDYNYLQLQSNGDRRILESQITKRLNEEFNKSIIKATFFAKMIIIPDMSYEP